MSRSWVERKSIAWPWPRAWSTDCLHVAPMLLGGGTRLFDGTEIRPAQLGLIATDSDPNTGAVHIHYRVG